MRILKPASLMAAGAVVALSGAVTATPAAAADLTCGSSFYGGMFCVGADGNITTYDRKNSPLRFGRATHMTACGDKIAVLSSRQIFMFDGKSWGKPIQITGTFGRKVACDPEGKLWVLGSKEAASWDGSAWKVHSREQMFGEDAAKAGFMGHIAVGPGGKVIVSGSRMVAYWDGKAWKVFKEGQGFQQRTFISGIAFDKAGAAYITTIRGLLAFKGDKWEAVPGIRGTRFITAAPDGSVWVGGTRSIFQLKDGKVSAKAVKTFVRDAAVDADGRLWVATAYGFGLVNGDDFDMRQMHNSELQDNSIRYIATAGKGGKLPEKKDQATGSIKGRLEWSDGEEIKGAVMQVCGTPPSFFFRRGTKPCDNKPLTYDTKTDDGARFEVKDVKASIYYIAILPQGNKRWIRISLGRRGQVLPGKTRNVGTIRVSARNRGK